MPYQWVITGLVGNFFNIVSELAPTIALPVGYYWISWKQGTFKDLLIS